MSNVTFKFIITETPLPADQDGRQQIIASISDDNAKRIMDLTGLAGEVEALKAHCHRMLNLARNRYLGYCDHNRAVQAVMEECGRMGMEGLAPAPTNAELLAELQRAKTELHAAGAELNNARALAEATRQDLAKARAEREKAVQCHGDVPCGACITCLNEKLDEAQRTRADQRVAIEAYAERRDSALARAAESESELAKVRDYLTEANAGNEMLEKAHAEAVASLKEMTALVDTFTHEDGDVASGPLITESYVAPLERAHGLLAKVKDA